MPSRQELLVTRPNAANPGYRANREALKSAQKPKYGTAAYSRLINRPAGREVAALFHAWGLSPNQATVLSATASSLGIALIALAEPRWWVGLAIAALLAGGYVLDSVDGQLARLRNGGSLSGEWLDHTIDCFKTSMLHLSVVIGWYRFAPVDSQAALLLPLAYEVITIVTYFGFILMPYLRERGQLQAPRNQPRDASNAAAPAVETKQPAEHPMRMWLILPTDYGFLCVMFVLWSAGAVFVALYAALVLLNGALLALALRKWWRELRAFDGL